jgi:hypothetical protein
MRKRFSERQGFVKIRDTFQIDSIDDGLKNRLWNKIKDFYIHSIDIGSDVHIQSMYSIKDERDKDFFKKIYDVNFKTSDIPSCVNIYEILRKMEKFYEKMQWFEIYDFIEYVSEIYHNQEINIQFREAVNQVLEEEMSGYRFVDNYIAPIIDEIEIKEVEEALDCKYTPVKQHLSNALELLSDRENPDYQNSIKESITAVESVAKIITGKETDLAKCLKAMEIDLNGQFKTSMIHLYGWTCKEDGIRHGHTGEELKTSFEEAKYMLVSCSAFVNYLIAKSQGNNQCK